MNSFAVLHAILPCILLIHSFPEHTRWQNSFSFPQSANGNCGIRSLEYIFRWILRDSKLNCTKCVARVWLATSTQTYRQWFLSLAASMCKINSVWRNLTLFSSINLLYVRYVPVSILPIEFYACGINSMLNENIIRITGDWKHIIDTA